MIFMEKRPFWRKRFILGLVGLGLGLVLAACGSNPTPTAPPDGLLRDGSMPKVLVTIAFSPTAPVSPIEAGNTPFAIPTTTPPPTQTPTPYIGVFLGQPTAIGEAGEIIVPPTIPPFAIDPASGSGGGVVQPINPIAPTGSPGAAAINCTTAIAQPFVNARSTNPALQNFGCPRDSGIALTLVRQPFERGQMYWRDTRQIMVLANSGTFWRVTDNWNEALPADDPAFAPPAGLLQPVRGFGFIWRSNEAFRNSLGWATEAETPISSFWQEFEGGSLFLGQGGLVYAVPNGDTGQFIGGLPQ
jgi:hypothetical protein